MLIFSSITVFAQETGVISGKIFDEKNKPLANVSIVELTTKKGTNTDIDGRFSLKLPAGQGYILEVSFVGYTTKTLYDIKVQPNGDETIEIALTAATSSLDTVKVKTSVRRETTNALITFQKNTSAVAQVISAESIKRSPDKNTADALKRVTGLSIQEGRYIIIRGLGDRYNQAMLNGILLSSTEPDRKTFSYDIFPASMVDNIIVNKTFIPEYSAEWAGGLVQVNTRDVPSRNFFTLQIGTGFNTQTIGDDFATYTGSATDIFGFDNGVRALNADFPTKTAFSQLSQEDKNALGIDLAGKSWQTQTRTALASALGQNLQLSGGFNTRIFGKELGAIAALTYNRSVRNTDFQNRFFNINDSKADASFDYYNNKYSDDVLAGLLANFSLKLNANNKISFKNLLNVNTSDYTTLRTGKDFERDPVNGENIRATETGFRTNTFLNTQIKGEHNLREVGIQLNWFGSFTILDQYLPRQQRLQYNQDVSVPGSPYYAFIGPSLSQKSGNIFYSFMNDYNYTAGGDITKQFQWLDHKQSVKVGYMLMIKDRLFDSKPFSIYLPQDNKDLLSLPPDQIFAPQNFGTDPNQFHFDLNTDINFRYLANTILNAGYLQFDNQFNDWLRVVWGVRYEHFDQLVGSTKSDDPRYSYSKVGDFLPAVNATARINQQTNVRLALSQTLVRPEFRELTNLAFYDFEVGATVVGNPAIKRTKISNVDLRYELYPRAGELVTVGIFFKYFENPIEVAFNQSGAGSSSTFNFLNASSATTFGAEFEFRKKLDMWPAMKRFTLQGNVSYMYNRVKFDQQILNRPMQGQSPYLVNAGVQYDVEELGLNTTALFNLVGRRILYVGNEQLPPIWEAPRPLLDLQVSKNVMQGNGQVKLNISDLFNRPANFYHDLNNNKSFQNSDALALRRVYGTNVSISFAYTFRK
jgi:TonB-dependent receptor